MILVPLVSPGLGRAGQRRLRRRFRLTNPECQSNQWLCRWSKQARIEWLPREQYRTSEANQSEITKP